jgi:hypothetical protein
MAILKILLFATMPFIISPLVSSHLHVPNTHIAGLNVSNIIEATKLKRHHGSTIYKSETDIPDFLKRSNGTIDSQPLFTPDYNISVGENRKYLEV